MSVQTHSYHPNDLTLLSQIVYVNENANQTIGLMIAHNTSDNALEPVTKDVPGSIRTHGSSTQSSG